VRVDVVTIFPEFLAPLTLSLPGKARESGLLDLRVHDLREWTTDRHRSVDDTPYGGGAGMVMRPEPWTLALQSLVRDDAQSNHQPEDDRQPDLEDDAAPAPLRPRLLVPSPAGIPFRQTVAAELAREPWLAIACGRYEGIDQRVLDHARSWLRVDEISLGDYVISGGESAAIVIVEAVVRLLPGVLGNPESVVQESHVEPLLEHPVYTRPTSWRGRDVPAVLLSGHHGDIARWRREQSLRRTAERRPDLLALLDPAGCTDDDLRILAGYGLTPGAGAGFHQAERAVADL